MPASPILFLPARGIGVRACVCASTTSFSLGGVIIISSIKQVLCVERATLTILRPQVRDCFDQSVVAVLQFDVINFLMWRGDGERES